MRIWLAVCLILSGLLLGPDLFGQFTDPLTFGGSGNENAYHLVSDQQGGFFISGTVDAPFAPNDDPLPVYGEEDLFLGRLNETGDWEWARTFGSFLDDEIRVVRRMPDGGLLLAGTFWLEFSYDDLQLRASDNIKGIFVLRTDEAGEWLWGKVINGSDFKQVNDVQIDPSGQIYLTGHFSEVLQFDALSLEARGDNDAFLLQLDPQGALVSWEQLGNKGITRGQTIGLHPEGGYYWGGVYDDTLRIDTVELYANTFDRDVFVSRYDATGQVLWAKRAGGVFEEELIAMRTDAEGYLYATGFLIGVMTLSEEVSVQSRNGNPDLFLFSYDPQGEVRWARAIGGELIDLPTDLCLQNNELIIGGTYQQQIAWDNLNTPLNSGVNGFIAGFDATNGNSRWLAPVTTENFAFVEALETDPDGRLFALGSFTGSAQLGAFSIESPGQYDMFLTGVDPAITSISSPPLFPGLQLSPNPVDDVLYLNKVEEKKGAIQIFDVQGRKMLERGKQLLSEPLLVQDLPPGTYWLVIRSGNKQAVRSFIVARPE